MVKKEFINAVKTNNLSLVRLLLKDKIFKPYRFRSKAIQHAAFNGFIPMIKLLLSDKCLNPSLNDNYAIIVAYKKDHNEIVELLWQNKRVKDTLKKDNLDLYNKLITKDIQYKIEGF